MVFRSHANADPKMCDELKKEWGELTPDKQAISPQCTGEGKDAVQ